MQTRCPTCTTTFRVTPEQLKARLGRVRCGQCHAVFNALDSLVEEAALTAATLPMESEAEADFAMIEPVADTVVSISTEIDEPASVAEIPERAEVQLEPEPEEEPFAPLSAELEAEALAIDPVAPWLGVDEAPPPPVNSAAEGDTELLVALIEAEYDAAKLVPHGLTTITSAANLIEAANEPQALATDTPQQPLAPDAASVDTTELAQEILPPSPVAPPLPPWATIPNRATNGTVDWAASTPLIQALTEKAGASASAANDDMAQLAPPAPSVEPKSAAETAEHVSGEADIPASPLVTEPPPVPAPNPLLHYAPNRPRYWPWALGSSLAALVLLFQLTLHYRVELATLSPRLKPGLQALCRPLGCSVPLPHKIDLLSIETSDLHPAEQKGQFLLNASLKNKAPFAQELPLLEVTLTDVADRVLIVKSLQPADYLPKELKAEAGFPARKEIEVNLTLDAGEMPAAGYRLYLYHP